MDKLLDIISSIGIIIGLSSFTLAFFGLVIAVHVFYGAKKGLLVRWSAFAIVSSVSFILTQIVLWGDKYEDRPPKSDILGTIFSNSFCLFVVVTFLATLIGIIGVVYSWLKNKQSR